MITTLFESLPARFEASLLQVTQWPFQAMKISFLRKDDADNTFKTHRAGGDLSTGSLLAVQVTKKNTSIALLFTLSPECQLVALPARQGSAAIRRYWLCFQGGLCSVSNVCKTHTPADWHGYCWSYQKASFRWGHLQSSVSPLLKESLQAVALLAISSLPMWTSLQTTHLSARSPFQKTLKAFALT